MNTDIGIELPQMVVQEKAEPPARPVGTEQFLDGNVMVRHAAFTVEGNAENLQKIGIAYNPDTMLFHPNNQTKMIVNGKRYAHYLHEHRAVKFTNGYLFVLDEE